MSVRMHNPAEKMRVIAVSHVANEEDIIEAFVRHTAKFCDEMIILDHGSADATPEILNCLKKEGYPLHLLHDSTLGHVEIEHLQRLLKLAAHDFSADWIIGLDADEFIGGAKDRSFLPAVVDGETRCMKLAMRSYYPTPEDRAEVTNVVERITYRLEKEEAIFKTLVPGWLAKKEEARWSGGKHTLKVDGRAAEAREIPGVWLDHVSLRSAGQYAIKFTSRQLQKFRHVAPRGSTVEYYELPYQKLRENGYAAFAENFHGMTISWHGETRRQLIHEPIHYLGSPLRYTHPRPDTDALIHHLLEYSERFARMDRSAATTPSKQGIESNEFTFEVTSRPLPGCRVVHKFPAEPAWQTLRCSLDSSTETTELHFHLCAAPGLLEIRRITFIPAADAGAKHILEADAIKSMLRVCAGGLAIWSHPGTTCRLLTGRQPLDFVIRGWNPGRTAPPGEFVIEFLHDCQPLLPTILATEVLDTINFERAKLWSELDSCRAQLAAVRSGCLYVMGSPIDFTERGNSAPYRCEGWSSSEKWGTWTDGFRATMEIPFSETPEGPLQMHVEIGQTLLHPLHPQLHVRVDVGGSPLASWTFDSPGSGARHVEIPLEKLSGEKCVITFDISNPVSPAELGLSDDTRQLGIGITRIMFTDRGTKKQQPRWWPEPRKS